MDDTLFGKPFQINLVDIHLEEDWHLRPIQYLVTIPGTSNVTTVDYCETNHTVWASTRLAANVPITTATRADPMSLKPDSKTRWPTRVWVSWWPQSIAITCTGPHTTSRYAWCGRRLDHCRPSAPPSSHVHLIGMQLARPRGAVKPLLRGRHP